MPRTAATTDEELIERARVGDQNAFKFLVERYEPRVAATVVGMLGRGPEAEDVGQETFIRFYSSLDKFKGEASVGTYLTRIAINQSLKALKKRRTWMSRFLSGDDNESVIVEQVVAEGDILEDRERVELVRGALQRLSVEHRAVVVLRILDGLSTKETAEMLDVPQGTVMSRLTRALQKLEYILGPLLR